MTLNTLGQNQTKKANKFLEDPSVDQLNLHVDEEAANEEAADKEAEDEEPAEEEFRHKVKEGQDSYQGLGESMMPYSIKESIIWIVEEMETENGSTMEWVGSAPVPFGIPSLSDIDENKAWTLLSRKQKGLCCNHTTAIRLNC